MRDRMDEPEGDAVASDVDEWDMDDPESDTVDSDDGDVDLVPAPTAAMIGTNTASKMKKANTIFPISTKYALCDVM